MVTASITSESDKEGLLVTKTSDAQICNDDHRLDDYLVFSHIHKHFGRCNQVLISNSPSNNDEDLF